MKKKRGFQVVDTQFRKTEGEVTLPVVSTPYSAGNDFYANQDYIDIKPNEIVKIWTDVKSYMKKNEYLELVPRSSMGGKFMLANTVGIIDSDYYSNPDNDGNIGIFLINISNETQTIKKGDRIAQGIFHKYLYADNRKILFKNRIGGFGSTNKKKK